jgi:uncharacterized protein (TIGR02246 family)
VPADEQVIQGILQQIETAWNRYDSISFAEAFAEDANFIHIFAGQLDGRPAIEAAHRHIFETIYRGSHASFALRNIRFLRPDVAVVFARCRVNFKGRQRSARNRNSPIVDRRKGAGQVADRRVPKHQDFRGACRSPSCNLVMKPRPALNQQQGRSCEMPMAKRPCLGSLRRSRGTSPISTASTYDHP